MKLYHVSCNLYEVGQKFNPKSVTPYHSKKVVKGEGWGDLKLNEFKPEGAPRRDQCYYAFDSLENCSAFMDSEKCLTEGGPYYYEVKMTNPVGAPMRLNQVILKKGKDSDKIESIALEYWNPTLKWKFMEYLSSEMEIIDRIDAPDIKGKLRGKNNYILDCELGEKNLWKINYC